MGYYWAIELWDVGLLGYRAIEHPQAPGPPGTRDKIAQNGPPQRATVWNVSADALSHNETRDGTSRKSYHAGAPYAYFEGSLDGQQHAPASPRLQCGNGCVHFLY